MYYILESKHHKLVSSITYSGDDGFGLSFLRGIMVDPPKAPDQLFVLAESHSVALPDYFEVDCTPIVNKKFIDALESSGVTNYQNFPVEIRFEDANILGHYVLNIIGRMTCIDQEESDYTRLQSRIMRIKKLKLKQKFKQGLLFDFGMFRADEYQEVIFISERVKRSIEIAGIIGCSINAADGWGDTHRF